ncbi:hypothetical protein F4777DRAFT_524269 [Nemania sp. FL0916]|nr:hypothetical protein F4777DRAFT_524269 [Nemania sp. FL0916]
MSDLSSNSRYNPPSQQQYAHTSLVTTSPRSFLYYIVADVGPDSSHRPVAVALRHGSSSDPSPKSKKCTLDRVQSVLDDCMRIFDIFSEPSNRAALEAELDLAASWYRGPNYRASDRVIVVPDVQQPSLNFEWNDTKQELPEPPWPGGMREFPFLSTCLRMGLTGRGTRLGDVQEQLLGTVFSDDKLEYGVVVFDLSDLNRVRYGIIGFAIKYMAEVDVTRTGDWDPIEDQPPERDPVPVLEEPRRRKPLNYVQYLEKFRCSELKDSAKALRGRPVIASPALEYIWPASDGPPDDIQDSSIGLSSASNKRKHIDNLDQAIISLIQGLAQGEELDMSSIQQSVSHPEFQARLLHAVNSFPLALTDSGSSMQLLQLAYAGHSHLNWVSYGNLTYESISAALQSNQLRGAKALSLCIDHLGGSPNALFQALVDSEWIHEIHFVQGPTRENDELSSLLFAQLCGSSAGSALLRERRIFLTCAYSAPLRRKVWLPDLESRGISRPLPYVPPIHAFPVQHMFVRQQYVAFDDPKIFRPCHFFLGDALLDPERFAVGFLQYCRSIPTDNHLFSFACSPPTMAMLGKGHSSKRINPLAAENIAIPRRCDTIWGSDRQNSDTQVECWPMARDFVPGGWTVLISHEWYAGPEVDRKQPRPTLGYESEVPFIRYAFVRTRQRITINDETSGSASALEKMVGPDFVEVVGGLAEFFNETTGRDEKSLINRLLEDATRDLKSKWPAVLSPGMEYLSVLDDSDARTILKDFIEDITVVRRDLSLAMEAKPDGTSVSTTPYIPISFM